MAGDTGRLPFGFLDLDRATGGMARGELTLIGARPGVGKSTLLQQIAEKLARESKTILLCSAEMSDTQINDREFASETGIPIRKITDPQTLKPEEWKKVQAVVQAISEEPIYLPDEGALTTADVWANAKEIQLGVGLDLIIVDYIQLLADETGRTENERVSHISKRLKQLARQMDVPVLAVSQLNRNLEGREDKRPHLSDLRDSGSLEQDADVVLLPYRDDVYYDENTWDDTRQGRTGKDFHKGILEVAIAKHRQYGSNPYPIKLIWDGTSCRYRDYCEARL